MKLSPRIKIRMQTNNGRKAAIISACLTVLTVVVILFLPIHDLLFPFPSWRNISFYQIIKMHLSARPTHVNQIYHCPVKHQPGVLRSDLNLDNVKFYEEARIILSQQPASDKWKEAFMPALDRQDKISLLLLYAVFKYAMETAGLEHVVMHGSAMGAWRHHGLTPWDDDIDIAVHVKDWLNIKLLLSCIEGYTLDVNSNSKWSFFASEGKAIGEFDKRWPFLDIFLYSEDESYAWGLNYIHMRKFVFQRDDMFPVQIVPFECFMVPVPRHLRKVLEHQYVEPDMCVSQHVDHMTGQTKAAVTVPCQQISDIYSMYFTYN